MMDNWPSDLTPEEVEDAEERAAILEHDAKIPRDEAERQALEIVMRRRSE